MTDVVTKVSIGGQVYPFWQVDTNEGVENVYLTQAEYDVLTPAQKADTTKCYKIYATGTVPGSVIDADVVGYDNTDSGLTATNMQDAIDEIVETGIGGDIAYAPTSPYKPKYHWVGTQAQYDALSQYYTDEENDTIYMTI